MVNNGHQYSGQEQGYADTSTGPLNYDYSYPGHEQNYHRGPEQSYQQSLSPPTTHTPSVQGNQRAVSADYGHDISDARPNISPESRHIDKFNDMEYHNQYHNQQHNSMQQYNSIQQHDSTHYYDSTQQRDPMQQHNSMQYYDPTQEHESMEEKPAFATEYSTVPNGEHPPAQSLPKLWTPFWLSKTVLLLFGLVFALIIVVTAALFQYSKDHDGISVERERNHYAWKYGPTAGEHLQNINEPIFPHPNEATLLLDLQSQIIVHRWRDTQMLGVLG